MPFLRRNKKAPLRRRPATRRPVLSRLAIRRPVNYNPQPVFTETFVKMNGNTPFALNPNQGGLLTVSMDEVPQLNQYTALYTKYRILRCQYIFIPLWNTEASDANAANYNASLTPPVVNIGLSRLVFSIDNSPDISPPVAEDDVLQHNGAKIISGKTKVVMTHRPVPNTLDTNGVAMTFTRNYITFSSSGNIKHNGISWWHTQPPLSNAGPGYGVPYSVYCKLTFQLSDPR